MEFVEEFEFNNDAVVRGSTSYNNRYLHVYKDNGGYLFYEIDVENDISYPLSKEIIDFLVTGKRVFNHKKLRKYAKNTKV